MAMTRSKKVRRGATKKGKRPARSPYVTYRGLLHGAAANLSRHDKYGPRPIPQDAIRAEMIRLAKDVHKKLPSTVNWARRYCARHIQAAIMDDYFFEHPGESISVTPKARFRYRAARRLIRETCTIDEYMTVLCHNLDKDVGPSSTKTRAELLADNRALVAKLNSTPTASARQPLQTWNSLSTVTNVDVSDEDDYDEEDFSCPVAGPSSPPVTVPHTARNPYPSPESMPRVPLARTNTATLPEPATPSPLSALSQPGLISPVSPEDDIIAEGHIKFVTTKTDFTEDEDVLMLDVPGPCNLTVKFSAASLEKRITDLEKDVRERNETITEQKSELDRLRTERVALAQKRDTLQGQLSADGAEHADAMSTLNASIALRDKQISALRTACLYERTGKDTARANLERLQASYDLQTARLRTTEAQLTACSEEKHTLESKIAQLDLDIEAARGELQEKLRNAKEEHEVQLQLLRTQIDEHKEKKRVWEAQTLALLASIQSTT